MTENEFISFLNSEGYTQVTFNTLDEQLNNLGIDSLDAYSILNSLEERFQCKLPNQVVVHTCRDIIKAIQASTGQLS